MARRSILVAIVVAAAALVPVSAQAATPGVTSAQFASPVTFAWTPDAAVVTEALLRATGACPQAGGTPVQTAPVGVPQSSGSDTPGDGVFCYSVQNDPNLSGPVGPGVTVTVDTSPPAAGAPAPVFTGAPNFARGAIAITATSTDSATAVTNALHVGGATCDGTSLGVGSPWDTVAVADGAYTLCNLATDGAGHTALSAGVPIIVDNTAPLGGVVTPAAVTVVGGAAVALATDAADATAGVRTVRWQRSVNGTTGWANGNLPAVVAPTFGALWNTAGGAANNRPADGPLFLRVVVTDNAGNVLNSAATQITIDNTAPDVKAVVTAPPAVAGSPTLSWTPAHDAVGITRYDILRGAAVIGSVPSSAAATFSFNDKNAPDQATSVYIVRAFDGANHSADSNPVSVLVDSTAVTAAHNLAAATPTAAAPVLNWQAPATFAVNHYDVYRDGLLVGSTVGATPTFTDATAAEGTHDYAVLARDAAAHPGVLSSSFKVVFDKTAPTAGGAATAQVLASGQVNLAWPAAGDALSGVAGYIVRRASGATPPAAADGGTAVCAPTAPGCSDAAAGTGVWSYGVFARDGAGNVALIGTVSNVAVNDKIAPLAPTKLKVTRAKSKTKSTTVTFTLHWVKPTAADLDRVVVVLNLKRAPVGPADGKTIYHGLGTSAKLKLHAGQNGYVAIYAFDHSGNYSAKPIRKLVTLAALIPLRPLTGSVVRTTSPLLTWKAAKGSTYYNVQVFRNGKRLLVGWPTEASYRIPAGKLKPGTYVWFVWPAVQHTGSSPTFGKLIGRATFRYKK